ncbi:hypothetical protein [Methylobacterium sp. WL6]|jgi:hypothetical protein|uniref:hypothetical protein n=1 Tax=Methylobacterium sp. WL6 TaxID=2603901 RepID=UPI0011CA9490|nr:hypothetical protein [Methylobacterium sp. WL6]TXN71592.1 hypothetical protein FV230_07920 [Methylobacterium sp. WL6]
MPYAVEISIADPSSLDEENMLPMYLLPDMFDTVADAKDAAAAHIAGLGRDPATVIFAVTDHNGLTIVTSVEAAR